MAKITFEQVPESVGQLIDDVQEIKRLLLEKNGDQNTESDIWFNIEELCSYLPDKPVRATIYEKVQKRRIPFMRTGKKLIFLKSEIDAWLKQGRQKTFSEISMEAEKYNSIKKNKE